MYKTVWLYIASNHNDTPTGRGIRSSEPHINIAPKRVSERCTKYITEHEGIRTMHQMRYQNIAPN